MQIFWETANATEILAANFLNPFAGNALQKPNSFVNFCQLGFFRNPWLLIKFMINELVSQDSVDNDVDDVA